MSSSVEHRALEGKAPAPAPRLFGHLIPMSLPCAQHPHPSSTHEPSEVTRVRLRCHPPGPSVLSDFRQGQVVKGRGSEGGVAQTSCGSQKLKQERQGP